jgi:uncharacterized repeat protein (TIGR03803 family)
MDIISRLKSIMNTIEPMKIQKPQTLGMAVALLALNASVASAQFSVLHSFTGGADGANPYYDAPVVSGSTIYGTANQGAAGGGVVFAVNTDGTRYNVLHTFTNTAPDGYQPLGSVVLSGSTLFGTTYYGGAANGTSGNGTVFAVNTDGSGYQTLHSFVATTNGYKPYGTVTLSGSTLYGMTYYGSGAGVGSIYSLNTDGGSFTNLHTFAGGVSDGSRPVGGTLTLRGGTLYGTTAHGGTGSSIGTGNDGVVFSINTDGSGYTNLVNFTGGATNGANPYGSLTLVGTTLYGTTRIGGTANLGTLFSVNTDGTDFQTLFNFTGGPTNGANPNGALTFAGSCLVGTTKIGGSANLGTVFKINLDGSGFSVLHNFTGADGANPDGDLTFTNNTLYGWTSSGVGSVKGTVFAMAVGGYAFGGLGITNVLTGSVANGGLFWTNIPTWPNVPPSLPYTNQVAFALPSCDRIVASRLVMTLWGGTPDYTCQMIVNINGTNLPTANPFVFGTTSDFNALFSADAPCAYGSGYGVWLVALPVPGAMLHTNGSPNTVSVVETTPDSFDGRIQHLTLVAVYQSRTLTNNFDYALAEGSGDIYSTPTSGEVDQRTAVFGAVNPTNATAATLTALYTYGDTGQNDRLYFNGTQLGGDDIAQWDTSVANYGPSVVSFNVLTNLTATNTVRFSVASGEVPDPREGTLRPQLAALAVTRPITAPTLAITVQTNQANLTITGETNRTYTVLSSTDLSKWAAVGSFVSSNAISQWSVPATNATRFFRVTAQ